MGNNNYSREKFEELKRKIKESDLFAKLKGTKEHVQDDIFESEAFQALYEQVSTLLGEEIKPRVLMMGKTGTGKSSVLNALFGNGVFDVGVVPTSMDFNEKIWHTPKGDIVAIDARGFSDPNVDASVDGKSILDALIYFAENGGAHMAIMVLKCDDRALEDECKFLEMWNRNERLKDFPILVVINQVDKMEPVREWYKKPDEELNLANPIAEKAKNIREYFDWVSQKLPVFTEFYRSDRMILFAAPPGESSYNLKVLKHKIYDLLPVAAKTLFARAAKMQKDEGSRLVAYYSGAAATAVLANPLPGSDFISISAVQIAMTIHLGRLYNMELTTQAATTLLTPMLASLGGRLAASTIISWIPGAKNLIGAPLAFSITMAVGSGVNNVLASKGELSPENIKQAGNMLSENEIEAEYTRIVSNIEK